MKIRKKFLELTSFTYPSGFEFMLESHLPEGYKKDIYNNYYLVIGESTTMFTCHLDTACNQFTKVKHQFDKNIIKTDGTTILGADDKAGMTVMLYMIEKKIPGLYYFFLSEEVGCIGSSKVSTSYANNSEEIPQELYKINKVISFDRKGTTSVITSQLYTDCCSLQFANQLCSLLNKNGLELKPDDTGVLTDSAQFMWDIPECTNISVGYYDEHKTCERQDIEYLYKLCKAVIRIDWESLKIHRDPTKVVNSLSNYYNKNEEDVYEAFAGYDNTYSEFFNMNYTYIKEDGVRKKMYISDTWIEKEKKLIANELEIWGTYFISVIWDGRDCYIRTDDNYEFIGNRNYFIPYIPSLANIPYKHLCEELLPF
jgi:hypothetical protein